MMPAIKCWSRMQAATPPDTEELSPEVLTKFRALKRISPGAKGSKEVPRARRRGSPDARLANRCSEIARLP